MKIMHLCTGCPISFNGGITNYVRSLAEEQSKKGYEVIVVGGKDKNGYEYNFNYVEYSDFYVKPFTLRKRRGYVAYKKIEKIIRDNHPDLIHIHMILDVDTRLYKILKKYNVKYIVSLHDYYLLCPRIQMFKNGKPCDKVCGDCSKCATKIEQTFFRKKIYSLLKKDITKGVQYSPNFINMYNDNKKLLENAELLLPVSNRVMEIFKKSDINNKYIVSHIGNITADKFKKYKIKKRKDTDKIKILMLGSFSEIKGGNEFVKLSNALDKNKYEFYFLGRCSDNEDKIMKQNNIVNNGSYKQIDLPKILKEYDFGCVLSIWEDNGPQVVMELLNNNIPVIGTMMGGIPDFIIDGKNGFLYNPYDDSSFNIMIEKIKKLNPNDVEQMKENITPTTTTFAHFEDIDNIYKKILGENNE